MRKNFNIEGGSAKSAVIACFLVQEGAELYMQNHKGNTPLLICSPDVAALVTKFVDENKEERRYVRINDYYYVCIVLPTLLASLSLSLSLSLSTFHGSLCTTRGSGVLMGGATGNNPSLATAFSKLKVSPPPLAKGDASAKSVSTPLVSSKPVLGGATAVPMGVSQVPMGVSQVPMGVSQVPMPTSSSSSSSRELADAEECVLCDGKVGIVLIPCNHAVICRECSVRAKKCPTCKVCDGWLIL